MKEKWLLLVGQFVAHGALVYQLFYGSILDWFYTLIIYFCFSCMGLTMTMHRWLSHKSWHPPVWFQIVGLASATLCLMGSPLSWATLHREHHKHADTLKDPHSPHNKSWWFITWLIMFVKFPASAPKDLITMRHLRRIHHYYFSIHFVLFVLTYLRPDIFIPFYLAPAALCWLSGGLVASMNHLVGYRTFDTVDKSKNNLLTGYLAFGEGWHNNHHSSPDRPVFSKNWWEIDIGGLCITLIQEKK